CDADRMSCTSFRANQFRLFLYSAAYVLLHSMQHTTFAGTEVENMSIMGLRLATALSLY
ncbi:MAG: transposase, partial [Bacteroidales bacterium]|nr:transposase [Bacteroidales bacterium]